MFPDWLNRVFPLLADDPPPEWTRHKGAVDTEVTTMSWRANEVASVTTKLVCNGCNTTWMAQLEEYAKPILVPMIEARSLTLDAAQQLVVATWAVKTAIVIEPTLSKESNFSPEECSIVRTQARPPGSTTVLIAAIDGPIPTVQYRCVRIRTLLGQRPVFDLHVYTIQVGTLVLQIVRHDPPPTNYGSLEGIQLPDSLQLPPGIATQIFPPAPRRRWPPPQRLDWDKLNEISRRGLDMPMEWILPPSPPSPSG